MDEILPIIAAILGVLVSWVLSGKSGAMDWFRKLTGWGKLGVVLGICLVFGAAQYLGLGSDLVESIKQVLMMFLGSQVGYVMKPRGHG